MIWVAWRQFRTQALVTFGLLAAFGVLVLVTGLHLRDVYDSLGGAHCQARNDCPALGAHERPLADLLGPALLAIPGLLGMFWGAPLIARELESGTYRLAWTQTVTRRRWLSVRIALVGLAALTVAGLASWLVSWWFAPIDAVNLNRIDPGVFTERGIVAIGYAGFAFAVGLAAGALLRRTLPAMAATLLGFIAARVAFTLWVRAHLLPARQALFPVTLGKSVGFLGTPSHVSIFAGRPPLVNVWAISTALVGRAHHALNAAQLHDLLIRTCPTLAAGLPQQPGAGVTKGPGGLVGGVFSACLHALSHHLQSQVTYQPPGHYWPLQTLETAIFLATAFALISATIWRIGWRVTRKPAISQARGRTPRPLILTSVSAVAAVSLLAAGCGGNSSTTAATTTVATQNGALAYAHCMRSNGVPNFPDPTSGGESNKAAVVSALRAVTNSRAQTAQTACRHVNGGSPGTGQNVAQGPASTAAMLAFARCMRSRGFPEFPDPTHGQLSPEMVTAAGIDLHQPAVLSAGLACTSVTHGLLTRADIERAVSGG